MTLALAALLACSPFTQSGDFKSLPPISMEAGFVRTIDRTDGIAVSQTAARKLSAPGKPDVWLVGVAHIGLKRYYTDIQALLDAQDVVLFEGVKAKNGVDRPLKTPANAPETMYQVIGKSIGLDFQLSDIQYDRPNWVNSDLSLDELDRLNSKTSGGKSTQFDSVKKMLTPGSAQSRMIGAFFGQASPGMKEAFKIFLIDKLAKVDTLLPSIVDKSTYNLLLGARNKSVMDTFSRSIGKPSPPKSVAIFYGAAHQSDLERSLESKYGYKEVEQEWFTYATADRRRVDSSGRQFLDMLAKFFTNL
ncbi:MAG: hypothetical protein P4L46_14470 [Fimbriimonas sp.]|nr:hypothetical protein [Fimbriimonas sp.]